MGRSNSRSSSWYRDSAPNVHTNKRSRMTDFSCNCSNATCSGADGNAHSRHSVCVVVIKDAAKTFTEEMCVWFSAFGWLLTAVHCSFSSKGLNRRWKPRDKNDIVNSRAIKFDTPFMTEAECAWARSCWAAQRGTGGRWRSNANVWNRLKTRRTGHFPLQRLPVCACMFTHKPSLGAMGSVKPGCHGNIMRW